MLKLLRRKSFRKSKDLNSETNSFAAHRTVGPGDQQCGQYSVRHRQRQRRSSSASGAGLHYSCENKENNSNSLDRRYRHTADDEVNFRPLPKSSSVSSSYSEHPVPEIIQYSRPPENLSSPVRQSNTLLATHTESNQINFNPGCETTLQKLFFDTVVNEQRANITVDSVETSGTDQSPREINRKNTDKNGSQSNNHLKTESVIVKEGVTGGVSSVQPHPYVRRSSNNIVNKPSDKVVNGAPNAAQNKSGRKSVMTVLRQSFRKSKKDRPVITPKNSTPQNRTVSNHNISPRHTRRSSIASHRSGSIDDHSRVSVASVRASRTLTPSRVSIVSRTSLASRTSVSGSPPNNRDNSEGDQDQGLRLSLSRSSASQTKIASDNNNIADNPSQIMKTETSPSSGVGVYPIARSMSSKQPASYTDQQPSSTPSATPRSGGQRFLPETPKQVSNSATAVPPIYANVHQQMAPGPGNNRQLTPGIAKILEDSGNKRQENGAGHVHRTSGNVVTRTSSSSQVIPASIPKPAARMSLRQKVFSVLDIYI